MIFDPLPHSRVNLIKSEMAIRKDRLQKEKDVLQAITPWIVAGITVLGLVAVAYVVISGLIKISDNLGDGLADYGEAVVEAAKISSGSSSVGSVLGPVREVVDVTIPPGVT